MSFDLDAARARLAHARNQYLLDAEVRALDGLYEEVEQLREKMHALRLMTEEAAHAENLNAADLRMAQEELRYLRGERAAVVAWLREVAPNAPTRRGADELAWCADRIKRGEHRREEEP